jgi:hypothetical protein
LLIPLLLLRLFLQSHFYIFLILSFSLCLNIPVSTVVSSGSEGRRTGRDARRNSWRHSHRRVPGRLQSL